jgi:hypothetical protein
MTAIGIAALKMILSAFFSEAFGALQTYVSGLQRDAASEQRGELKQQVRQAEAGAELQTELSDIAARGTTATDVIGRLKGNSA